MSVRLRQNEQNTGSALKFGYDLVVDHKKMRLMFEVIATIGDQAEFLPTDVGLSAPSGAGEACAALVSGRRRDRLREPNEAKPALTAAEPVTSPLEPLARPRQSERPRLADH